MAPADGIEFRVLGPMELRREGGLVKLGGIRRRALLARLLLAGGRVVPADVLIEDVWDGRASSAATATLQSHVSQLRKAVGFCVETHPAGYALCKDGPQVDAWEFERLVSIANEKAAERDHIQAAAALTSALGLWRGRPYQEVADKPWAIAEVARLEEMQAESAEQILRTRLDAGEALGVVPAAEAAVAEHPLREQRWAVLMLALYRSGRQADALRAYQRLRSLLAEQLGIDPAPSVAALEAAILRHDPKLDLPRLTTDRAEPGREGLLASGRAAAADRAWRSAYEFLHDADRRSGLQADDLELFGDMAFMAGEQEASVSARQRAHFLWLKAGDVDRAAIAAFLIVGNYYVRNRPATAAGWYHKGRHLLQDRDERLAHGVLAYTGALIALAQSHPDAALAAASEAHRIGLRFGDRDVETLGLALRGCALARMGRIGEAEVLLDESLASASTRLLGPVATGQVFCWSIQAWLAVGDYQRAAEWIEMIESCGVDGIPGDCRVHRAEVLRALDRLDEAEVEATTARSEIQSVDLLHAGIAYYELAMIYVIRGDLRRADQALKKAAACGASIQPGLAVLRAAQGDVAGSKSTLEAALADPALDPLRRARLLPAAIQLSAAADARTHTDGHAGAVTQEAMEDRIGSLLPAKDGTAKRHRQRPRQPVPTRPELAQSGF